jgi:hypothetical protein
LRTSRSSPSIPRAAEARLHLVADVRLNTVSYRISWIFSAQELRPASVAKEPRLIRALDV